MAAILSRPQYVNTSTIIVYEIYSMHSWYNLTYKAGYRLIKPFKPGDTYAFVNRVINDLGNAIAPSQACKYSDSKVHVANMGPIWDRQDPGGPHVGPMNFALWTSLCALIVDCIIRNEISIEINYISFRKIKWNIICKKAAILTVPQCNLW